jgi:hypothetical protein
LKVLYRGDFRAFLRGGSNTIRDNIIDNIKHQRTPTGATLKRNSEATLKIKKRLGKGQLSLVWDKLLISKSSWFQKSSKKKMIMGLTAVRKKIGKAVTKEGYIFMGISKNARVLILDRWRKFIKRGLGSGARRGPGDIFK